MITIVDYGAGNIKSVSNMLTYLGITSCIASDPRAIERAERLILPGVGHFGYGMAALKGRAMIEPLTARVVGDGVPILGICLGAHLMMDGSAEDGEPGLGWVNGSAVRFDRTRLGDRLKLPHMGWAATWAVRDNPLVGFWETDTRFYHAHSYHMMPRDETAPILKAAYGHEFTTGIEHKNILGVQFHPEKSHRFGLALLHRFADWDGVSKPARANKVSA